MAVLDPRGTGDSCGEHGGCDLDGLARGRGGRLALARGPGSFPFHTLGSPVGRTAGLGCDGHGRDRTGCAAALAAGCLGQAMVQPVPAASDRAADHRYGRSRIRCQGLAGRARRWEDRSRSPATTFIRNSLAAPRQSISLRFRHQRVPRSCAKSPSALPPVCRQLPSVSSGAGRTQVRTSTRKRSRVPRSGPRRRSQRRRNSSQSTTAAFVGALDRASSQSSCGRRVNVFGTSDSMFEERFVAFDCDGDACIGVLAVPKLPIATDDVGVLVIVGGPQTRVGSHRQFVLLARALAAAGIPAFRFDYRGMGDSAGDTRTFEHIRTDLFAALDVFQTGGRRRARRPLGPVRWRKRRMDAWRRRSAGWLESLRSTRGHARRRARRPPGSSTITCGGCCRREFWRKVAERSGLPAAPGRRVRGGGTECRPTRECRKRN